MSSDHITATLVVLHNNLNLLYARAQIERENHDLTLEQIKLKAAEHRVTVLESVKCVCVCLCVCVCARMLKY